MRLKRETLARIGRIAVGTTAIAATLLCVSTAIGNYKLLEELGAVRIERDDAKNELVRIRSIVAMGARSLAVAGLKYSELDQGFVGKCPEDKLLYVSSLEKGCGLGLPKIVVPILSCGKDGPISIEETVHSFAAELADVADDSNLRKFVDDTGSKRADRYDVDECVAPDPKNRIKDGVEPKIELRVIPFFLVPGQDGPEDCEPEIEQPKGKSI